MSELNTQIISGVVTGAVTALISFWAAHRMAQQQRQWDAEDAATAVRAALIRKARIPLEIILEEIRANWGFYYTRDVEQAMTTRLREAIYDLGDRPLIDALKEAVLPLREFAGGNDRKASGEKVRPQVEKMLKRLSELDTALALRPSRPRLWSFRVARR